MRRRRKARRICIIHDRGFFIVRCTVDTDLEPLTREVLEGTELPARPPRFSDPCNSASFYFFNDLPVTLFGLPLR